MKMRYFMIPKIVQLKSLLSRDKDKLELGVEAYLFKSLDVSNKHYILKKQLIDALKNVGLDYHHAALLPLYEKLAHLKDHSKISLEKFIALTKDNISLVEKAITGNMIIPDFPGFCAIVNQIFAMVSINKNGHVADYIPQLSRVNPDLFGLSVCTVDGQLYSTGDWDTPFSVQSAGKTISYCLAQKEHGEEVVHRYIGKEPSGHRFNVLRLNKNNLPHNPFINTGALMACSLIKNELDPADRFDYVIKTWNSLTGNLKPGFNNAIYLSERNHSDRNFAIAHFMQEKKVFPPNTDLTRLLEFYFQCCSIEVNSRQLSIVAATLANSGICPLTQEQVFEPNIVKNCLSLMYSCGLYDFSGEFAFTVGLPAKSGVSGCLMLIIPHVLGICIYSPPVDQYGNSVRAIDFAMNLVKKFNIHAYDSVIRSIDKHDLCQRKNEDKLSNIISLIWAASQGDLMEIKRLVALGVDLNEADYDGRTAVHLAASEGQTIVINYLIKHGVDINPLDRWGGTPLADAKRSNHQEIVILLLEHGGKMV